MDIKLYYRETGVGEPLILLHGNGEDGSYFRNQIEYFGKKYRVIALDTRGHGGSERGSADFSIKQFAIDLADFMDEQGIDKAIILGFSDGANIAMEFALKYPDRVRALVLNGGNLRPLGVKIRYQLPIVTEYLKLKLFGKRDEKTRRYAELLGLMVREPKIPICRLAEICVPTLVIAGSEDMIREGHTKRIAKHISGAQLSIIEGDHFIAANNPEKFNGEVESFLNSL